MSSDDRLISIRRKLLRLNNRATAIAQERDDSRLGYPARSQAVFTLIQIDHNLQLIIDHNIMPHYSKNERLQMLQEENKKFKQEINRLQNKLHEQAPDDDGTGDGDSTPDTQTDAPVDILEGTNAEVGEAVADIDDVDTLEALLDAELEGDNRKGAVGHIESRINELADNGED